ncbi:MAG: HepT-like ribonuclease domain-containing protein [Nitrospinota bacterium]|mgnify:CR=1 FL=1
MVDKKIKQLLTFINETIDYFLSKIEGVDRDFYFADRDKRNILDKSINDIILCLVDIAEECLKKNKREIPDTYRDTILACHEFIGDIVLKIAPLVKHRNETIHQYLKMNWQNITIVRDKIGDIREFVDKMKKIFMGG